MNECNASADKIMDSIQVHFLISVDSSLNLCSQ